MLRTKPMRLVLAASVLALVAALTGCGSSSKPTEPAFTPLDQQTAESMAQILVLSISQDLNGVLGGANPYGAQQQPLWDGAMSSQAANEDTSITIDGLTYWFSIQYFDGGDNPQSSYDSATTVRMVVAEAVSGTISDPGFSMTVGSAGLIDVRGLDAASDTLTTSGVGSDTLEVHASGQSEELHLYMLGNVLMDQIKQLKPVDQNEWPLSGTIAWTLQLDLLNSTDRNDVQARYQAIAIVTFNGTKDVDIVFQEGFRFQADLQAGTVQPA